MTRRCTSFDVAEGAGVSQSTVSKALRGSEGVSVETRRRVLEVAAALDYRPDQRAVSLRSSATGRIAVVILGDPKIRGAPINSFYMDLLAHVAAAAADHDQEILVSFQHDPANFFASYCQDRIADGIIVIGTARNSAGWRFFAKARSQGENVICWGSPDDVLPTLRCDNHAGAATAVRHLVATGRRRIIFIGPGWRRQHAYRDRRSGYISAMSEQRLPVFEAQASLTGTRELQGYAATLDLMNNDVPFDAIFAASDGLAVGAMQALNKCGRIIPEDVAVIGFDGIGSAPYTVPPLSTVEQNGAVAGSYLVEALHRMIAGEDYQLPAVPLKLIWRASSCASSTNSSSINRY
ncbi:LacI family DNA-binding transcriptional regulator [Sphingomonas faeni]|uniref:LacI family DNA-binding transcriptional regulator n=1 Tax=Sphingomonas faeni TaxID=185950 RepID=UPI00334B22AC